MSTDRLRITRDGNGFLITEGPDELMRSASVPHRFTSIDLAARAWSPSGRMGNGPTIETARYMLDSWGTVWSFTPTRIYEHGRTIISTPLTGIGTVYPADGARWVAMGFSGATLADGETPSFGSAVDAAQAVFTAFFEGTLSDWQRTYVTDWHARVMASGLA